jgi:hypothetical protein
LLKQEDFENLTSYETESIKTESAYKIILDPVLYDPPPGHQVEVFKRGSRIFIHDMNQRLIEAQLDEALAVHNENLKEIAFFDDYSDSHHIENLKM